MIASSPMRPDRMAATLCDMQRKKPREAHRAAKRFASKDCWRVLSSSPSMRECQIWLRNLPMSNVSITRAGKQTGASSSNGRRKAKESAETVQAKRFGSMRSSLLLTRETKDTSMAMPKKMVYGRRSRATQGRWTDARTDMKSTMSPVTQALRTEQTTQRDAK